MFLQLLTADGGGIEVGAEVYFRVKDPVLSVTNVQDLNHSSRVIAQTALARTLASKVLADIDTHKLEICQDLQVTPTIGYTFSPRYMYLKMVIISINID